MLVENIATTEFFWKQNLGYALLKRKIKHVHDYTKITP